MHPRRRDHHADADLRLAPVGGEGVHRRRRTGIHAAGDAVHLDERALGRGVVYRSLGEGVKQRRNSHCLLH